MCVMLQLHYGHAGVHVRLRYKAAFTITMFMYKHIWPHMHQLIDKELECMRKYSNPMDAYAVEVICLGITVGHIPQKNSAVCSLFVKGIA